MNWYGEHSDPFGFADVNSPEDLAFAEWVLSGSYSLSKFDKEAKELRIPLEKLIWMRFREYDGKRKDVVSLPREEQGKEDKDVQEPEEGSCCSQGYHG